MKYTKLTVEKASETVEMDVNRVLSRGWTLINVTDDTDEYRSIMALICMFPSLYVSVIVYIGHCMFR